MADLNKDRIRDLATQLKGSAAQPVAINIIADALLQELGPMEQSPPHAPAPTDPSASMGGSTPAPTTEPLPPPV